MITKRGSLIVFEGISGTGKETQAKLLKKYLSSKKIKSVIVFHPSPELKPQLRRAVSARAQIELLASDRADRVRSIIDPALENGEWVISLRNYVSAMVYQGDEVSVKKVDREPDFLFYFDQSPEVSMKRIISRGEPLGKYETRKLLEEKRKKYLHVLTHIPHETIDATQTIDSIASKIVSEISHLI